jgi:replicative DNA helicase
MRRQMIENAAFEVATQVRAVEDTIEAALAEIAELQSRIIRARPVTRVPFTALDAVFQQLTNATCGLVTARAGIGSCHVALAEAKQFVPGLRETGWGDDGECPKTPSGSADLRIVA